MAKTVAAHRSGGTIGGFTLLLWLFVGCTQAGVVVVREGYPDPLLGLFSGTTDNTITGHFPDLSQPPDAVALNVGSFFPEPRGGLLRFDVAEPILKPLVDNITSARITLWTQTTSSTADQDMPVNLGVLSPANSGWYENTVNWRYKNSQINQPWASGSGGPTTSNVDYHTPVSWRVVKSAEMNSTGTPIDFGLDPNHVDSWIQSSASNAGAFYWSTLEDNGGANLDDNFQVRSSENSFSEQRPTLTIRYRSPFTRQVFDAADLSINNGDGFKDADNSNRLLTWGEAYIMSSYAQMYRATQDTYYLDKLVDHADTVLANRDDFANFSHEIPGNNPIWTSGTDGTTSVPLSTGHILQPMARFSRLVNEDPVLAADPTYAAKATQYIQRTQESIDYFNDLYLETVTNPTRSYYAPTPTTNATDAVNTDSAVGTLLLDMFHATGNLSYRNLAMELAQSIETNAFYTTDQGNLAWSYKYNQGASDAEDVSHATHGARFLASMGKSGLVINAFQGQALAASLIEEAFQAGGTVTAGIDGSSGAALVRTGGDPFNWSYGMAAGLIDLAQFDLRMIPVSEAVQLGMYGTDPTSVSWPMLSIANLVRYARVPQELEATLSVSVDGTTYSTTSPIVASLLTPGEIVLVNENDPGDIHQLTLSFGGSGNEKTKNWQLSASLNAAASPILLGGTLNMNFTLLDGNGAVKNILGSASTPSGFTSTLSSSGDSLAYSGTLDTSLSFLVNANETSPAGVVRTWLANRSGDWHADGNWTPFGVPSGTAASVVLGDVISSTQTVFTNSEVTVGSFHVTSPETYIVAGAGSLKLQGENGLASLRVDEGQHEFQLVLDLESDTTAAISGGAKLNVNQAFHLRGNTLTKTGTGELAINNLLTTSGGTIDIQQGTVSGSALVTGNILNDGGVLSPGNSPGTFQIAGNYRQKASGTLLMELAGNVGGGQYDILRVGGVAELAGELHVQLNNGFLPAAGDAFELFEFSQLNGQFDHIALPVLVPGFSWNVAALYTEGVLSVATSVPEPASIRIFALLVLWGLGSCRHWITQCPK